MWNIRLLVLFFVCTIPCRAEGQCDKGDEGCVSADNEDNYRNKADADFCYFGYGSNLLTERVRLSNPSATFMGVGFINDYSFGFASNSKAWHGATANIFQSKGAKVYGVVWKMDWGHSDSLDEQESGYDRINVRVHMNSGETLTCRTYNMPNMDYESNKNKRPSPHYKHVILSGALEHELPGEYQFFLLKFEDNRFRGTVDYELQALKELNSDPNSF